MTASCLACGQPLPTQGLHLTQRLLRVGGEERWLTVTEWLLLARFHKGEGKWLAYETLLQAMRRGHEDGVTMQNLRAYVLRVRAKLLGSGYRIICRSGFGYMLERLPERAAHRPKQSSLAL